MLSMQLVLFVVMFSAISIWLLLFWAPATVSKRPKQLPPGPPVAPFVGNLLVFPKKWPHYQFTKWAREYGDIFSLKVMHLTIIVLNTPTAVRELIDRRGALSCNRPKSIIADMITPDYMNIGSAEIAGETWRTLRKAAVSMLSAENVNRFKPIQRAEAIQLMWEMLQNPENFYQDISRFTTSFFMSMIYGQRAPRSSTPEAKTFSQVQLDFMHVVEVGKLPPVDLFPVLKLVPERFAPWKSQVLDVRRRHEMLFGSLLDNVKRRVSSGTLNGAFMEEACMKNDEWGLSTVMLLNLGGTLLEGSDTSSGVLQNLVLCLVAYPDVQRKAQSEVDRVIGSDRLPNTDDIDHLPYMKALVEEVFRFRPVGPLAIPHALNEDLWYDGMFLPKGAALFINLWAIFHDPRYFDEPEKFEPERFMNHPLGVRPDVLDDPARRENMTFGGGRRVCPGIAIAKAGILINAVNFLWAFNFEPAKDSTTGALKPPDLWAITEGVNATPLPFACTITPRSQDKAQLIREQFMAQSPLFEPFEQNLSAEDVEYVNSTRGHIDGLPSRFHNRSVT